MKFKDRLKRRRIDWYQVLIHEVDDPEAYALFCKARYQFYRRSLYLKGKRAVKSWNRIAYQTLRSFYGDRRMLKYRITGEF